MSVVRFGKDSDVYVYGVGEGASECCGCRLQDGQVTLGDAAMYEHLKAHVAAGHKVPSYALEVFKPDPAA